MTCACGQDHSGHDQFYTDLGKEIAWEVEKYGDPYLLGVMSRVRAGDGFIQNGEELP